MTPMVLSPFCLLSLPTAGNSTFFEGFFLLWIERWIPPSNWIICAHPCFRWMNPKFAHFSKGRAGFVYQGWWDSVNAKGTNWFYLKKPERAEWMFFLPDAKSTLLDIWVILRILAPWGHHWDNNNDSKKTTNLIFLGGEFIKCKGIRICTVSPSFAKVVRSFFTTPKPAGKLWRHRPAFLPLLMRVSALHLVLPHIAREYFPWPRAMPLPVGFQSVSRSEGKTV